MAEPGGVKVPEEAVEAAMTAWGTTRWGRGWRTLDCASEKTTGHREQLAREIVKPLLAAAAPAILAAERERLLHPFLIQAVALECDRLKVDPATGPSAEELSRVEAEVRREIERAFELATTDYTEESGS